MKVEQATAPSLDEFRRACLDDFGFLISECGFAHVAPLPEKYPDPFEVHFERDGWRIIVHGLSYGFSLDLEIGSPDGHRGSFGHLIPAGMAMSIRQQYRRGQLGDISCAARCLRDYGDDFLRGDWRRFQEIVQLLGRLAAAQRDAWQKEQEEVKLRFALRDADLAFRKEDYDAVIRGLESFESALSPAQKKKLEIARKRKSAQPGATDNPGDAH